MLLLEAGAWHGLRPVIETDRDVHARGPCDRAKPQPRDPE
jgi:hypothetical protein